MEREDLRKQFTDLDMKKEVIFEHFSVTWTWHSNNQWTIKMMEKQMEDMERVTLKRYTNNQEIIIVFVCFEAAIKTNCLWFMKQTKKLSFLMIRKLQLFFLSPLLISDAHLLQVISSGRDMLASAEDVIYIIHII